jgi:hypothetical protein
MEILDRKTHQVIGTSTMGIFIHEAKSNISTSKIQPSTCMLGKMEAADFREISLNPHCVSLMLEMPKT